jgi:hypothetical protein
MVMKAPSRDSFQILGVSDEAILERLYRYRYLTSKAVCRLYFKSGCLIYAQTKLKRLADLGYARRCFLPRASQHGSAPSVYCISRKGLKHLAAKGIDVPSRYPPVHQPSSSYLFLSHTLMVNDVLITAELLDRNSEAVTLQIMHHEFDLKRSPFYVQDDSGERLVVIPDGYFDFRIRGQYQACFALEADRATEEQRKFRRKVRGLVGLTKGAYQERFGTSSLTVAVVTTDERRLAQLRHWTEAELEHLGRNYGDLFRFATLSEELLSPEVMFFGPRWYRPFDDEPMPLLEQLNR